MKPDIYIKVRFRTNAEGGRKTPLKRKISLGADFYACPMIVDGKAYDCRLLIGDKELALGEYYEIPVKFLDRDAVSPNLAVGKIIILWEGKQVAEGEITKICEQ